METLDHTFTGTIGRDVIPGWDCVRMPDSKEFFGTGKAVKIVGTIDGYEVSTAMMPTGDGGHMIALSAKVRTATGKGQGDEVTVHLTERLS